MHKLSIIVGVPLLLASPGGAQTSATDPPRYTITDLGSLPTSGLVSREANAVSDKGEVVGECSFGEANNQPSSIVFHAFLWRGGKMMDLGTYGGFVNSSAVAISDTGKILIHAFAHNYWSEVRSNWGEVIAGDYLWDKGKITDVSHLSGHRTSISGMNGGGDLIGTYQDSSDDAVHPFLWHKGRMKALPFPQGLRAGAISLNGRGRAVEIASECS